MGTLTENHATIFGYLMLMAQQWQYLGDKYLAASGLTMKQWQLLATVGTLFDHSPTVTEAAQISGTSRQNVKQLALKLEQQGFLKLVPDSTDRRILRLETTAQNSEFWDERRGSDAVYLSDLFSCLTDDETETLARLIKTLGDHTELLLNKEII